MKNLWINLRNLFKPDPYPVIARLQQKNSYLRTQLDSFSDLRAEVSQLEATLLRAHEKVAEHVKVNRERIVIASQIEVDRVELQKKINKAVEKVLFNKEDL